MDELLAFLRQCLDGDERVAREALSWTWQPEFANEFVSTEHIARWDPARVLAEVEAKRRILDLHASVHDCPEMVTGTYPADWPPEAPWGKPGEHWAHADSMHYEVGEMCPTMKALAQPYAGRDGWREEWRA